MYSISFLGHLRDLLLLFLLSFVSAQSGTATLHETVNSSEVMPLNGQDFGKLVVNETRRRLGVFRIGALCTCCGSSSRICFPSCCYTINCNIPNKPFGFCSFTPKFGNCFGCHI